MNFRAAAIKACEKKGLKMLSHYEDGGYWFVKDKGEKIFPVTEVTLMKWIKEFKIM